MKYLCITLVIIAVLILSVQIVTEIIKSLFKNSVKNAVADALKGKSPKVGADGAITKDDIMKIKDTKARQKAIKENIELFQ